MDGLADDAWFFFASSAACAAKARAEKLVTRKAVVSFMDGTLLWLRDWEVPLAGRFAQAPTVPAGMSRSDPLDVP
jgi:hypothetical protein